MTGYLLLRRRSSGGEVLDVEAVIHDHELPDVIAEDDAPRFIEYAAAGDYYDAGAVVVVKLGRRFADDQHKP